jgi:hypothetical protein
MQLPLEMILRPDARGISLGSLLGLAQNTRKEWDPYIWGGKAAMEAGGPSWAWCILVLVPGKDTGTWALVPVLLFWVTQAGPLLSLGSGFYLYKMNVGLNCLKGPFESCSDFGRQSIFSSASWGSTDPFCAFKPGSYCNGFLAWAPAICSGTLLHFQSFGAGAAVRTVFQHFWKTTETLPASRISQEISVCLPVGHLWGALKQ